MTAVDRQSAVRETSHHKHTPRQPDPRPILRVRVLTVWFISTLYPLLTECSLQQKLKLFGGVSGGKLVGLWVPNNSNGQQDRHSGQQHMEQHPHCHCGQSHGITRASGMADLPRPGCQICTGGLWRLRRVSPTPQCSVTKCSLLIPFEHVLLSGKDLLCRVAS